MHIGYIWAAVSSSPQIKNVSLDAQLADSLQYADRYHARVTGALIVPGRSRYITLFDRAAKSVDGLHLSADGIALAKSVGVETIIDRIKDGEELPGIERCFVYAKLLELVEAHKFNVLFFLNRSRIGRKAALSMTIASLCAENGVKLFDMESPPASLDVSVSHDEQLIGAVKSVGFERDVHDLIEKTKKGIVRRVENGNFPNRPPWGYTRIFDSRGAVIGYELDPEVKTVVQLFAQMYLEGQGQMAIAIELNRRNTICPTPGGWNNEKVRGLLSKTWAYAGYGEINRQSVTGRQYYRARGNWEPVFDEETARRIVAEQKSRLRKPKAISNPYRFSRCVICDHCGRNMGAKRTIWRAKKGSNVTGWRNQYRCLHHGLVSEKKIERALKAYIRKLDDQTFRDALLDNVGIDEAGTIAERIATLTTDIERRRAGITKADDDHYLHGTLDEDRHRAIVSAGQKQIETMLSEITSLQDRLSELDRDRQKTSRIGQIRNVGMERAMDSNVRRANAWIRENLRIYIADHEVKRIAIV